MAFDTESVLSLDAGDYIAEANAAADASEDFAESAEDTQDTLFDFDSAGFAASSAIAGVGASMQVGLDRSQDWRESLGRSSETMGITSDAAEDLAGSISDATFPMDDAVETMDSLAQQGIDTEDDMETVALAMDNVADATGDTAANIAESMGPALSAFGHDLQDSEEHMDTFTWVARNTTQDVGEFAGAIERLAPELQEMEMGIDDTAVVMAALEDKGITGRQAVQQFRQATNNAEGDQSEFMNQLGLSEDALDRQTESLAEAEGITNNHASAANNSVTTMDRLNAVVDGATLRFGSLLQPVSAIAPALMGLGGAGMFVSTVNVGAVIPSLAGVLAGLTPLLPVILPLVAIAGVLGGAWHTNFLGIRDITTDSLGTVQSTSTETLNFLRTFFGEWFGDAVALFETHFGDVDLITSSTMASIHGAITTVGDMIGAYWDLWGEDILGITTFVMTAVRTVSMQQLDALFTAINVGLSILQGDWDGAWTHIEEFTDRTWARINDLTGGALDRLYDGTIGRVTDIHDGVIDRFESLKERLVGNSIVPETISDIIDVYVGLVDWVSGPWNIGSAVRDRFAAVRDDGLSITAGLITGATEQFAEFAGSIAPDFANEGANRFRDVFNSNVPSSLSIPSVSISNPIPGEDDLSIGGGSIDLPQLATGGRITGAGAFIGGEEGPEHVLNADQTATVDRNGAFVADSRSALMDSIGSAGETIVNVSEIVISANSRSEGRRAMSGAMDELHKQAKAHNLDRSG